MVGMKRYEGPVVVLKFLITLLLLLARGALGLWVAWQGAIKHVQSLYIWTAIETRRMVRPRTISAKCTKQWTFIPASKYPPCNSFHGFRFTTADLNFFSNDNRYSNDTHRNSTWVLNSHSRTSDNMCRLTPACTESCWKLDERHHIRVS